MALAIGIDLGTTNSVAAVATPTGIRLAAGEDGRPIHPSMVSFPESGGVLVGQPARPRRPIDPKNTVYSAKRLIGQDIRSPLVGLAMASLPFEIEEGSNRQPIVVVRGGRFTVPEISAMVLGHLKSEAARQFGDAIDQAVITVPANFSDGQRQATREAGRIAGLEVLRLVNEPTAAALACGFGKRLDEIVAVFDFGGGTFDVSLLKIRADIFEVLATDGDFFLGGDDIDRTVAEHLAAEMSRAFDVDPRPLPQVMTRLRLAAEEVKCYLSSEMEAAGEIDGLLMDGRAQPLRLPFALDRRTFERMIEGYADKTIALCRQAMTAARLDPSQISDVIMVGGSTRIPMIRERVADLFGRPPRVEINPDEIVGQGAAILAAMLSGRTAQLPGDGVATAAAGGLDRDDARGQAVTLPALTTGEPGRAAARPLAALLLDVTPATLGIATVSGYSERLLEKNSPIPIERTRNFTTGRDQQDRVVIECCRGEARRFDDNEPLGAVVLEGIAPAARGEATIEVTFRVDADGILHVRATDVRTGLAQQARLDVIGAPVAPGDGADLPARG